VTRQAVVRRGRPASTSKQPDARSASEAPLTAVFAARALTKTHQMGEVAVQAPRGVDFDPFGGEFLVLLGPSGSGKSTLLNILGGLVRSFRHRRLSKRCRRAMDR
jgi:ABC-type glutathione transport system ATPase component